MHSGVKLALFLIASALIGFGGAKAFMIWAQMPHKRGFEHTESPAVVTGVGDAPANHGFCAVVSDPKVFGQLLDRWQSANATAVGVEYTPEMDRAALVARAKMIEDRGMSVVLLPPGASTGSAWSDKNPYPRPLGEIGADAEAAGIQTMCISWLNHPPEPDYWREQVRELRLQFSGKLILAADGGTLQRVACPDVAEIMGAIGPIEIPRRLPGAPADVSVTDLRVAWNCTLTQLESFAKQYDKKLALLHMDVPLMSTSRLSVPGAAAGPVIKDSALQSELYEALLLETKGRSATTQFLIFDWGAGKRGDGDGPNDALGVMGKIAPCWAPAPRKPALAGEATSKPVE